MKIVLDDTKCREAAFPFSLTRHIADIRIGILTIREKWEKITGTQIETNLVLATGEDLIVAANIIPSVKNIEFILQAAKDKTPLLENDQLQIIQHPWNIFQKNSKEIIEDFDLITSGRDSFALGDNNIIIGNGKIFAEKGCTINNAMINTQDGPVYFGENVQVMEGCLFRGPVSIGRNSVVKMGSKIYGGTSIGPHCIIGGEIKNSVLFGYSNKAHDGYLGDSVLGEWCNLGAGTSNSNVKNTGGDVAYFLGENKKVETGTNKGGLLMADYSRCAVNTAFNTAVVVGVCCNIFGSVHTKKYFHHFSWGNEKYNLPQALSHINNWKKMKGESLSQKEIENLTTIYNSHI